MNFRNILIYTTNFILLVFLVLFSKYNNHDLDNMITYNNVKQLNSTYITYIDIKEEVEIIEGEKKEELQEKSENIKVTVDEEVDTSYIIPKSEQENKLPNKSTDNVIETFVGNMTGYGPDCYGCTSNRTASGYFVGNGNIYYADKEYGNVRIVAGDKKYSFGTIVKLSNLSFSEPIIAIVLDRGSAIGNDKLIQFDLLYDSENSVKFGIEKNIQFDILRLGF